jgi:hypothetical protein
MGVTSTDPEIAAHYASVSERAAAPGARRVTWELLGRPATPIGGRAGRAGRRGHALPLAAQGCQVHLQCGWRGTSSRRSAPRPTAGRSAGRATS